MGRVEGIVSMSDIFDLILDNHPRYGPIFAQLKLQKKLSKGTAPATTWRAAGAAPGSINTGHGRDPSGGSSAMGDYEASVASSASMSGSEGGRSGGASTTPLMSTHHSSSRDEDAMFDME
jgi:hypothetical protein